MLVASIFCYLFYNPHMYIWGFHHIPLVSSSYNISLQCACFNYANNTLKYIIIFGQVFCPYILKSWFPQTQAWPPMLPTITMCTNTQHVLALPLLLHILAEKPPQQIFCWQIHNVLFVRFNRA